jgi:16S rRNA (adenine1518-N6/adenine1519-N6)-dimethyltransferase
MVIGRNVKACNQNNYKKNSRLKVVGKVKQKAKDTLRKLQVRPSKNRGQNFIIEPYVIEEIVSFGRFSPYDSVVEIGPGLGALTAELASAEDLTLIEIEENFCNALEERFPKAKIIHDDVREVEFKNFSTKKKVVFGNLPYSFSTDIVFHLLSQREHIDRVILLLQKEFAARVAAKEGSRTYGVLSIMVQVWSDPELGPVIPGEAFHPATAVNSQILALQFRTEPRVKSDIIDLFDLVVRLAFLQRRKKILNSLKKSKYFSDQALHEAFAEAEVDPNERAEDLSIASYEKLARALKSRVVTVDTYTA